MFGKRPQMLLCFFTVTTALAATAAAPAAASSFSAQAESPEYDDCQNNNQEIINQMHVRSSPLQNKAHSQKTGQCNHPCDDTLPDCQNNSPLYAKFLLYRGNCRYTWSVNDSKDQ